VSTVGISEEDWDTLLQRIADKECVPFIGAGACAGTLPIASELAQSWADEHEYPLRDSSNLGEVAQFVAIKRDSQYPKQQLRRLIRQTQPPDFSELSEPHRALAELELPIYLTTNYDSFMIKALEERGLAPIKEVCGWNELIRARQSATVQDEPKPGTPLVYYLHGHHELTQSMVLTEDDYLEFLVRLTRDASEPLLPYAIRAALAEHSLLFVGYSLSDWSFRVLFRGLLGSLAATLGSMSVAVQLDPLTRDPPEVWLPKAQEYLQAYFGQIQRLRFVVYWGNARAFALELSERWGAFRDGD
jgi:hypothetical protein